MSIGSSSVLPVFEGQWLVAVRPTLLSSAVLLADIWLHINYSQGSHNSTVGFADSEVHQR